MSPTCTPFGIWELRKEVTNYDDSQWSEEKPRPKILQQHRIHRTVMHQSMTGLNDAFGYLYRKLTVLTSSAIELLQPFLEFVCGGWHTHVIFAQAIIDDISNLKIAIATGTFRGGQCRPSGSLSLAGRHAEPDGATHQHGNADGPPQYQTCIAYKRRYEHMDLLVQWTPAAAGLQTIFPQGYPLGVPHSRTTDRRPRAGKPRKGRHPRLSQEAAMDETAADLQPKLSENIGEAVAEDEQQATQRAGQEVPQHHRNNYNDNDDDDDQHERTTRPQDTKTFHSSTGQ